MPTHDHRWTLALGQVQRLQPGCGGRWLAAEQGRLWLTRTGGGAAREADVWLQPGQRQWLAPGSEWLVEGGAPDSAFVLLEPPPARAAPPAVRPRLRLASGAWWLSSKRLLVAGMRLMGGRCFGEPKLSPSARRSCVRGWVRIGSSPPRAPCCAATSRVHGRGFATTMRA